MTKRSTLLLALLAALALGLTACGGSGSSSSTTATSSSASTSSSGATTETVDVAAAPDGSLAFQESSLKAKPGNIDLHFNNPSSTTHDVCVRSSSGDELGCSDTVSDGTADLAVDLKPGTYTFYCSVDSHEAAGMHGTLTVK